MRQRLAILHMPRAASLAVTASRTLPPRSAAIAGMTCAISRCFSMCLLAAANRFSPIDTELSEALRYRGRGLGYQVDIKE